MNTGAAVLMAILGSVIVAAWVFAAVLWMVERRINRTHDRVMEAAFGTGTIDMRLERGPDGNYTALVVTEKGEPVTFRLPEGYDPDEDHGATALDMLVDYMNRRDDGARRISHVTRVRKVADE